MNRLVTSLMHIETVLVGENLSARGIEALFKVNHGTNKSLLESQVANINELFSKEPPRSIGEAILKIKEFTGIQRSYFCVQTFFAFARVVWGSEVE